MDIAAGEGVRLGGLNLNDRVGGVGYKTNSITGWWEPTASTGNLVQREGASGGWMDEAHSMGRHMTVKGSVRSDSYAETAVMLEAIWAALPIQGTTPLVVEKVGRPKYAMVRQEDKPDVVWLTDTYATFDFQVHSKEWRLFSGDGSGPTYSQTVGLPRTEGGRRRPFRLPSAIDAEVISGAVRVSNAGNAPAPVEVRFDGPVPSPTVRTPDGQWQTFDLDVLAGQSLVIDQTAKTVLLNGVTRRGSMRGDWIKLSPGSNSLIFDAASYNEAARMTVSWSDSWK